MDKIMCGIATFSGDNFGACLQAYALQKVLKNWQIEPQIIQYVSNTQNNKMSKIDKLKTMSIKDVISYVVLRKRIRNRKAGYSSFRKEKLSYTDEVYYRDSDLEQLNEIFDFFICGSDMIWAEDFKEDWKFYYLNFALRGKTIAYAPSFGRNEISSELKATCLEYLKHIEYLSCREETGVQFIKQTFGLNAVNVLDPTLLLTKEEWLSSISNDKITDKNDYILTYVFGRADEFRIAFFEKLIEKSGNNLVIIPAANKTSRFHKYEYKEQMGPIEFLKLYRDAKYIITDTFHGLIFALIFNKPFVVLKRTDQSAWARHSDRLTSLLNFLGLGNLYIDCTLNCDVNKLPIVDYKEVNSLLDKRRSESLQYLKESIQGVLNNR